jgi:1-phosphofructokinase family hexose kinase
MILCVVPNAAVEYTWTVPGLELGRAVHVKNEFFQASGKGMNVAHTIQELGGQAFCIGLLAGHIGELYASLADRDGIPGEWVWADGETRIAIAAINPDSPQIDATLISAPGPVISIINWDAIASTVLAHAQKADIVCFSGSLPPSTPLDRFQALIQQIQANHVPVWVDSSGSGLVTAIKARAAGIKANAAEIGEALGQEINGTVESIAAAHGLLQAGIQTVVVTLGSEGAVLVNRQGAWAARPPAIQPVSTVGSGDAFLGGLLMSLSAGEPIQQALRKASAAGAANTLQLGGGRLHKQDYENILKKVEVKELA